MATASAIAQKEKPWAAWPTAPRLLQWNATSHADRHGHGCPSARRCSTVAAPTTAALHR